MGLAFQSLLLALVVFAGGSAVAAPSCDALEVGSGRVSGARLAPGTARPELVLDDGRSAILAGVLLPAAISAKDRDAVVRRLEQLAGETISIRASSTTRDRRGRLAGLLAEADGHILQLVLLQEGLAVADGVNGPCPQLFLQAEQRARTENRGIWRGSPLITEKDDGAALPDFIILHGRVRSVGHAGQTIYLNFGANFRTDPTVRIGAKDAAALAAAGIVPDALAGSVVEARGWAGRRQGIDLPLPGPAALVVIGPAGNGVGTK